MCPRFSYDELQIVPYLKRCKVSGFESTSPELDEFLKEDALKNQEELLSKTYLCYYSSRLVGYVTFTTDIIKKKEVQEEENIEIPYKEYPAIKIARLAVDTRYERRGVGRFLLLAAVGKALKISEEVGCRFITVDSKQESIGFYKKSGGFKLVRGYEKKKYPTMYFDVLPTIKEMKAINTELEDFSVTESTPSVTKN